MIYNCYLQERETQGGAPAFYLDMSEFFYRTVKNKEIALRILTSIVELGIEEPQLYRIIGYKLDEYGELELAVTVFEKVLKLRENEPQSHRDLGNMLCKVGRFNDSLQALWKVVTGQWDSRFDEIELTALTELNRVLWLAEKKKAKVDIPKDLDARFKSPVDVDLRVSMAWDTDMTDVDLHTIEPTGEECYYSHKETAIGGLNSRDFTGGYGPEEYMCKVAVPGVYKVRARYYSSHQQSLAGGTTILLTFFTNYSRPNEEMQLITIRLAKNTDIIDVGDIKFGKELGGKDKEKFDKAVKEEDAKDAKIQAEIEKERKTIPEKISVEEAAIKKRIASEKATLAALKGETVPPAAAAPATSGELTDITKSGGDVSEALAKAKYK